MLRGDNIYTVLTMRMTASSGAQLSQDLRPPEASDRAHPMSDAFRTVLSLNSELRGVSSQERSSAGEPTVLSPGRLQVKATVLISEGLHRGGGGVRLETAQISDNKADCPVINYGIRLTNLVWLQCAKPSQSLQSLRKAILLTLCSNVLRGMRY